MVFFCYFFIIVNIMIVTLSVPVYRVRFFTVSGFLVHGKRWEFTKML